MLPVIKRHKVVLLGGALRISFVFLLFGTNVILSRALSMRSFGEFTYVLAYLTLTQLLIKGGWPQFIVREVASRTGASPSSLVHGVPSFAFRFIGLTIVLLTVPGIFIAYFLQALSSYLFQVYLIGLVGVYLSTYTFIVASVMRGWGRIITGQLAELVIFPAVNAALLALLYAAFPGEFSPELAMAIFTLSHFVAFSWSIWIGRPDLITARLSPVTLPTYAWLKSVLRISFITWSTALISQLPLIFLGILSSTSEVAHFRVAFLLANLVPLGLSVTNMTLAPTFSRYWNSNDRRSLQIFVLDGCRLSFLSAVLVGVPLIVFHKAVVVYLFGADYVAASTVLVFLCAAQLFNTFFGSVGGPVVASNGERNMLGPQIVSLVVMVVVSLISIPQAEARRSRCCVHVLPCGVEHIPFLLVLRRRGIWSLPIALSKSSVSSNASRGRLHLRIVALRRPEPSSAWTHCLQPQALAFISVLLDLHPQVSRHERSGISSPSIPGHVLFEEMPQSFRQSLDEAVPAIVRDPADRIVSTFRYAHRFRAENRPTTISRFARSTDVNEFVLTALDPYNRKISLFSRPAASFVRSAQNSGASGPTLVRFDQLLTETARFFSHIGVSFDPLPNLNAAAPFDYLYTALNPEARRRIAELYHDDLLMLRTEVLGE